eukprot:8211980-Pyramimonas_sp.AAC.1
MACATIMISIRINMLPVVLLLLAFMLIFLLLLLLLPLLSPLLFLIYIIFLSSSSNSSSFLPPPSSTPRLQMRIGSAHARDSRWPPSTPLPGGAREPNG